MTFIDKKLSIFHPHNLSRLVLKIIEQGTGLVSMTFSIVHIIILFLLILSFLPIVWKHKLHMFFEIGQIYFSCCFVLPFNFYNSQVLLVKIEP